jgi:hypothetical protein
MSASKWKTLEAFSFLMSGSVDLRLFNFGATNGKYSAVIVFFYVCNPEDRRSQFAISR